VTMIDDAVDESLCAEIRYLRARVAELECVAGVRADTIAAYEADSARMRDAVRDLATIANEAGRDRLAAEAAAVDLTTKLAKANARMEAARVERDEARAMLPTAEERDAIIACADVTCAALHRTSGSPYTDATFGFLARTASGAQQTPGTSTPRPSSAGIIVGDQPDRVPPSGGDIGGPSGAEAMTETCGRCRRPMIPTARIIESPFGVPDCCWGAGAYGCDIARAAYARGLREGVTVAKREAWADADDHVGASRGDHGVVVFARIEWSEAEAEIERRAK